MKNLLTIGNLLIFQGLEPIKIEKETDKAVMIYISKGVTNFTKQIPKWLPKSCIEVTQFKDYKDGNAIELFCKDLPDWLMDKILIK